MLSWPVPDGATFAFEAGTSWSGSCPSTTCSFWPHNLLECIYLIQHSLAAGFSSHIQPVRHARPSETSALVPWATSSVMGLIDIFLSMSTAGASHEGSAAQSCFACSSYSWASETSRDCLTSNSPFHARYMMHAMVFMHFVFGTFLAGFQENA